MNLNKTNTASEKKFYFIFYILFFVGIAGHFSDKFFDLMLAMTPYILLLTGVTALIMSGVLKYGKFIIWFIAAYIFTVTIEIAGVHTGKIFGEYSYGEVLGYKLYGVPLIIGFNWLFVILGAFSICNYFSKNNFIVVFFTAVLATVFDYLLEPVAMDLGYWNWANIIIPFQNYLAWFIISFLLSLSLIYFRLKISSEIYIHFFTAQLIFFLFLNFR